MKKLLIAVTIAFTFVLSACDLTFEEGINDVNGNEETFTEEDIRDMIEDILDSREEDNMLHMDQEALTALIESLILSTVDEDVLLDVIEQYIQTDLTEEDIRALITDLLPEDRYQSIYDLESFQETATTMIESKRQAVLGVVNYAYLEGYEGDPDEEDIENGRVVQGTASGVIYKYDAGYYYLVTNQHVTDGFDELELWYELNGILFTIENADIEFLGDDATTDMAVMRFQTDRTFPVVEFADSYALSLGQFVFAIGNPLGFDYFGTVTMGVLSGTTRFLTQGDFSATVLQHDAPLSPGNSGGALFDINGNLIGINHMKIIDSRATNIGFAVPSNTVSRIASDLELYGEVIRPFLGISSAALVNLCGMDYGVCLAEVMEGFAAAEAGLEAGDVITGYKHEDMDAFLDIYNFNDLREAILNSRVGDVVIIRYVRDGVVYESLPATLTVHPDDA